MLGQPQCEDRSGSRHERAAVFGSFSDGIEHPLTASMTERMSLTRHLPARQA
jgi:hypothetical protein